MHSMKVKHVMANIFATFEQECDTCKESSAGPNTLDVEVAHGGGGPYIVISTERWALDFDKDVDELIDGLRAVVDEARMVEASLSTDSKGRF